MSGVIYLDNAATTAVDPRVMEAMLACLSATGDYANPSATNHAPGRRARERDRAGARGRGGAGEGRAGTGDLDLGRDGGG